MAVFYDENGNRTVAANAEEIDRNGTWYDRDGNLVGTVSGGADGNTNRGAAAAVRAETVDNKNQIHYTGSGSGGSGAAPLAQTDYNSLLASARNTLNSNASSLYRQAVGQVNQAADRALQQSYIRNRLAAKNLNQQMAQAGLTGGANESTLLSLQNQYGNNRAALEQNRLDNLAGLGNTYQQTVAGNDAGYYNSLADMQAQREQQQRAYQLQRQAADSISPSGALNSILSTGIVSAADRLALQSAGYTETDIAAFQKQGQQNRNLSLSSAFSQKVSGSGTGSLSQSALLSGLLKQQEFYYQAGDWDNYNAVSRQIAQIQGVDYLPYSGQAADHLTPVINGLGEALAEVKQSGRYAAAENFMRSSDGFLLLSRLSTHEEQADFYRYLYSNFSEDEADRLYKLAMGES